MRTIPQKRCLGHFKNAKVKKDKKLSQLRKRQENIS